MFSCFFFFFILLLGLVGGLIAGGALYYAIFVYGPNQNQQVPGPAQNNRPAARDPYLNPNGGSSFSQTQARGEYQPADKDKIRKAHEARFGSISDVRSDKM